MVKYKAYKYLENRGENIERIRLANSLCTYYSLQTDRYSPCIVPA